MTNGRIVKAYNVLEKLANRSMPIKMAYSLFKLRQQLKPIYTFFYEREKALVDELKPTIIGDGKLQFLTVEDKTRWEEKHTELTETETDIVIEPVSLLLSEDFELSPNDVEALDGFVTFDD